MDTIARGKKGALLLETKISDNVVSYRMRVGHTRAFVLCMRAGCETAYTGRVKDAMWLESQRDIPLVMFPRTFLSPFVPLSPCSPPCPAYHASRPALSRVRRSHECACIREFVFQLSGH